MFKDIKSTSPVQPTAATRNKNFVDYDMHSSNEAMKFVRSNGSEVHFPNGVPAIILDYLNDDISPASSELKEKCYADFYKECRLFGRTVADVKSNDAAHVAQLILSCEFAHVNKAISLVEKKPFLLRCVTMATDRLNRRIKGTPLQIAAMAGDVNLLPDITEEKHRGLVERLIDAGKVSQKEAMEQLQVITSKEAKKANAARNERIMSAIIKFGKAILKVEPKMGMLHISPSDVRFEEFHSQHECQVLIEELNKSLELTKQEIITSGYVFDTNLLYKACEWFESNVAGQNKYNHNSSVYWIHVIGKLQSMLSARDLQVIWTGIGDLIDKGYLPKRHSRNLLIDYDRGWILGVTGYRTYNGNFDRSCCYATGGCYPEASIIMRDNFRKLVANKAESVKKIVPVYDESNQSRCCIVM